MDSQHHPWFAVRVRSHYERLVSDALRGKGYEEFLPLYTQRRQWSDRMKTVSLPLLPGYVFSRFAVERRLPVLTIPGVIGIVGHGREPVALEDREVDHLKTIVGSGLAAQPWPFLHVGERVRIVEGPLRGVEGVLTAVRKKTRLVVAVTLLQRAVSVEMAHDWATSLDTASRWSDVACFAR